MSTKSTERKQRRANQIERLTWSTKALQPIDELLSTIPSDTARKAVQIVRQVAFEVGTVREQLEREVA